MFYIFFVGIKLMDISFSLSLSLSSMFIMSSVSLVLKCNYFSSDHLNK